MQVTYGESLTNGNIEGKILLIAENETEIDLVLEKRNIHSNKVNDHSNQVNGHSNRINGGNLMYKFSIMPMIIMTWCQMMFNFFVIVVFVRGFRHVLEIFENDLGKHMNTQSSLILENVISCSKEYVRNNCSNSNILPPALEPYCQKWANCMNSDIDILMSTKETAHVLADIINNFFGQLSNRSITCIGCLIFSFIIACNAIFIMSRRQTLIR